MSKRKRDIKFNAGEPVTVNAQYNGVWGSDLRGAAAVVKRTTYPAVGGKFVYVNTLDRPDRDVLCFTNELDRRTPDPQAEHEARVTAWAEDPEGKQLVQNILDRKDTPVHVYAVPRNPGDRPLSAGDTVQYLGTVRIPVGDPPSMPKLLTHFQKPERKEPNADN